MFPDGFPLSPIDAIKFSANFGILTAQEEADWYKWLESATPEQQKELVDTLHQIYISNNPNPQANQGGFQQNSQFNNPGQNSQNSQNNDFQNYPTNSNNQQNFQQNFQDPKNQNFQNQNGNWQNNRLEEQNNSNNFQNGANQNGINNFNQNSNETTDDYQGKFVPNFNRKNNYEPTPPDEEEIEYQKEAARYLAEEKQNSENSNRNQDQFLKNENPSEESFLNLVNSKYSPNPILTDDSPNEFSFDEKEQDNQEEEQIQAEISSVNPYQEFAEEEKHLKKPARIEFKPEEEASKIPEAEPKKENVDDDFSFVDAKEEKEEVLVYKNDIKETSKKPLYTAPEQNELEELYRLYMESQKLKLEEQNEFQTNYAILQGEAHQKQVSFWDKVMQVISNYEQMADKVLSMNEQIVRQAKEIQTLKNSTQARSGISLQDQINSLRYDLERTIREFDDYRTENYRRQKDITEQVAAATADTYKTDGMLQKIDLLANRLTRIETQR